MRGLDRLEMGDTPKLRVGAFQELSDALLADPQVQADLRERLLGATADPMTIHDDESLAPVEPAEQPLDHCSAHVVGLFLLDFQIGRREWVVAQRDKYLASAPFPSVLAREL